jgi:hypothetical protein
MDRKYKTLNKNMTKYPSFIIRTYFHRFRVCAVKERLNLCNKTNKMHCTILFDHIILTTNMFRSLLLSSGKNCRIIKSTTHCQIVPLNLAVSCVTILPIWQCVVSQSFLFGSVLCHNPTYLAVCCVTILPIWQCVVLQS